MKKTNQTPGREKKTNTNTQLWSNREPEPSYGKVPLKWDRMENNKKTKDLSKPSASVLVITAHLKAVIPSKREEISP